MIDMVGVGGEEAMAEKQPCNGGAFPISELGCGYWDGSNRVMPSSLTKTCHVWRIVDG